MKRLFLALAALFLASFANLGLAQIAQGQES